MNDRQSLTEFEIIRRYFSTILPPENDSCAVALGVGDDCALLAVPDAHQLAISIDTLVVDRHFPAAAKPADIARRAVAVSVSDLAAMGARPLAFTMALSLPEVDAEWLADFSAGLRQAAGYYQMPLVGGDTTRGPLTITLQVHGSVPSGQAMQRDGASAGDSIFVTGSLGDAAAALAMLQQRLPVVDPQQQCYLQQRFYAPEARVALAQRLRSVASAAIDVSDGLLADLGHLSRASGLAATIKSEQLPLSKVLQQLLAKEQAISYALSGGDDYELCFSAAPQYRARLASYASEFDLPITEIGSLAEGEGVICLDHSGRRLERGGSGYQHF